jgi:DNA-binding response OmpR family regulator
MATILLVEEDPLEAHMIMPLLEREFGDVRRATDAAMALGAIEQVDVTNEIGLVILGQLLQGIRKPEFVAELHDRMPELPVLVLGAADESPSDYLGDNVTFLPRPLAPREMVPLANKLRACHKNAVT